MIMLPAAERRSHLGLQLISVHDAGVATSGASPAGAFGAQSEAEAGVGGADVADPAVAVGQCAVGVPTLSGVGLAVYGDRPNVTACLPAHSTVGFLPRPTRKSPSATGGALTGIREAWWDSIAAHPAVFAESWPEYAVDAPHGV
ncbi:hypothetical protein ABZU76_13245, partial [Amycolatopsis sp. NPDC005232]|uniref:hypothetical protein n=1 Tax=Amycolatopsis sp. NPDC005232 TaxID=3157027 RepID=UPI00339DFDAE